MEYEHDEHPPESLALRSLVLPAAASALLALGAGLGFPCVAGPGAWTLLGAPAFAAIGAVGGPERKVRRRVRIGLLSTAINLVVMVCVGMGFAWVSCRF